MRQGDIVINCPIFLPLKGLSALGSRETPKARGVRVWVGGAIAGVLPAGVLAGDEGDLVARSKLNKAILLTRGCDIDQSNLRQVAPIFPLSMIRGNEQQTDAEAQAAVINGEVTSLHFLQAERINDWVELEDSYVDFRYVTTLHRDLFDRMQRIVGRTQAAVGELMLSWVRHATGRDLVEEVECNHCGRPVPILDQVTSSITPGDGSF